MIKTLKCLEDKGLYMASVSVFNSVPLSRMTMQRRIIHISSYLEQKLEGIINNSSFCSIALDESTDITDLSQLLVFVRTIDTDFVAHEEMLRCCPLTGNTRGVDTSIFKTVLDILTVFGHPNKLCGVCTDGAPFMAGEKHGLVGMLKKLDMNPMFFHCIIHQEALCAKSIKLKKCMDTIVTIVNKISGGHNALTHRYFKSFLAEFEAQYGDLNLHNSVRWLSQGNCLLRFFKLRKEVEMFLNCFVKNSDALQLQVNEETFLPALAFLNQLKMPMLVNTLIY